MNLTKLIIKYLPLVSLSLTTSLITNITTLATTENTNLNPKIESEIRNIENKYPQIKKLIKDILISRFNHISASLDEQINQIESPLILSQLIQVAEIIPSVDEFELLLISNSKTNKTLNPSELEYSSIASDLYSTSELKLFSQSNQNDETIDSQPTTEDNTSTPSEEEQAIEEEKLMILGAFLAQLNGSPYVFGTPSTVMGKFSENTQLTGDWGGDRLALPQKGIFFDVYATTVPQGILSGGNEDGTDPSVTQNIDAYLNIVAPWEGAILHVATCKQKRFDPQTRQI